MERGRGREGEVEREREREREKLVNRELYCNFPDGVCVCVCVCVCCSYDARISGVSVTVPDFFPILKFLQHSQRPARKPCGFASSGLHSMLPGSSPRSIPGGVSHSTVDTSSQSPGLLPVVPEVIIETSSETIQQSGSHDSQPGSHDLQTDSQPGSHDLQTDLSAGIT